MLVRFRTGAGWKRSAGAVLKRRNAWQIRLPLHRSGDSSKNWRQNPNRRSIRIISVRGMCAMDILVYSADYIFTIILKLTFLCFLHFFLSSILFTYVHVFCVTWYFFVHLFSVSSVFMEHPSELWCGHGLWSFQERHGYSRTSRLLSLSGSLDSDEDCRPCQTPGTFT